MPIVAVVPNKPEVAAAALPECATPAEASKALLDQLLASNDPGATDTTLVRALGETSTLLRETALRAATRMTCGAGAGQPSKLLAVYERIIDNPQPSERGELLTGAVLGLIGELGEFLDQSQLAAVLSRNVPLLAHDSSAVATGAARGVSAALRGALRSGLTSLEGCARTVI